MTETAIIELANCIFVKKLAKDCNMNYDYKNKILPFFGMYVFD